MKRPAAYMKAREAATLRARAELATLPREEIRRRREAAREATKARLLERSQGVLAEMVSSGSIYLVLERNLRFLRSRRADKVLSDRCMAGDMAAWRVRLRLAEITLRHDEILLGMTTKGGIEDTDAPVEVTTAWPVEADKS